MSLNELWALAYEHASNMKMSLHRCTQFADDFSKWAQRNATHHVTIFTLAAFEAMWGDISDHYVN